MHNASIKVFPRDKRNKNKKKRLTTSLSTPKPNKNQNEMACIYIDLTSLDSNSPPPQLSQIYLLCHTSVRSESQLLQSL